MSSEQQQLEAAIAALEARRGLLGDAVVDEALESMRTSLAVLRSQVSAEHAQQLKQVTIVFLDVVGSTTLTQKLDPEEVHTVLDGALTRCTGVVRAHRGKVLQYAGDNLLAAFGADKVSEDDAERAVRCGLALLAVGRALGEEVLRAHGHTGFNVRVGIHTGRVLLGGGVDDERSIRGIAVNIAARMEQIAPPGALRITHATYVQVRGMFEVEPQPPVLVKGVDEPLASYLVRRAKPRTFRIAARGIEDVETHMIGRDTELEALQDGFKRLLTDRKLSVITIVAEAGVGKSRLLSEFEAWAEARPETFLLFRGRARPHTRQQPYGLLRDILAWRLQIEDDDTLQVAQAKIEQGIAPLFEQEDGADLAESHAHLLGFLIGIDFSKSRHLRGILDDPQQIRDRAFHTAAQMLRRLSARDGSPIVVQLEDLHWADDGSLDFLSYLAKLSHDVPMLVLASTRPNLFERRTDWQGMGGNDHRVDLAALNKAASRDLTSELLKKLSEVPFALGELIIEGAEGNPFYMEELVKMFIDQGAIETHGPYSERWTFRADKFLATHVPPTLTGVLQARLDGLPSAEKLTLQEASVIGHVFWDQALFALDEGARETLPALVKRELTMPRPDAAVDGLREYVFRHQILHKVTYDTVLRHTRRDLHGKLANWLSRLAGARANDFLAITAEHYEKAADPTNAAQYHALAAAHASGRFAHDAVLRHVQRALALLDATRASDRAVMSLRWRLLAVREQTLDLQGRRAEQRADLDQLDALASALADQSCKPFVAWRRANLAMRTADGPGCMQASRHAMQLAELAGDVALRLRAQQRLAVALASLGDFAAGKAMASQGLAEARKHGLRYHESLFLNALLNIAGHHGDLMGNLELSQQDVAISREIGDRRGEAIALGNLGAAWMDLGNLVHAEHDLEEALRLTRANGDRALDCGTLCNLSWLALWQGEGSRALLLARQALETAEAVEARDLQVIALFNLASADMALGQHGAAALAYEQARDQALEMGSPWRHDAAAGLARVALAKGDMAAALQAAEGLRAHLAQGGTFAGTDNPRLIELTCHKVLARAGDSRATEWLSSAHGELQTQAAKIPDAEMRRSFLNNLPHHREILAAWQAQYGGSSAH